MFRTKEKTPLDGGYPFGGVELHPSSSTTDRPDSALHGLFLGGLYALVVGIIFLMMMVAFGVWP